jgi:hypothetical protein
MACRVDSIIEWTRDLDQPRFNVRLEMTTTLDAEDLLFQFQDNFDSRSRVATDVAAVAFARLLDPCERRNSGQIVRIARFLAATYNGQAFPLDPFEMRAVDIEISDDMMNCLDALRWGRADLHTLVPDGDLRVRQVIEQWGLQWPGATGCEHPTEVCIERRARSSTNGLPTALAAAYRPHR